MSIAAFPIVKKNTNVIFESASYLRVIDAINTNIHNNTNIVILTGESRTGKTLVARKILKSLLAENFRVFFQDPRISVGEMFSLACNQIGVTPPDLPDALHINETPEIFFNYLTERSQEKGPVRFIIDDAQDINIDTLSNILKFTKQQPEGNLVLQLILIGLPKLNTLLTELKLPALENSNPVYLSLTPLDIDEVSAFVAHHLDASDIHLDDFLSPETIDSIAIYTHNIPGLISILVDSVIAIMKLNEQNKMTVDVIDEAVDFFSLPWAIENKKRHMAQLNKQQEETDSDQSSQTSSRSEDNVTENSTLLAKISKKVATLFSHNTTDSVDAVHVNSHSTSNTDDVEKASRNPAENVIQPPPDQAEARENVEPASMETLAQTQESQVAHQNVEAHSRILSSRNQQINTKNIHEETMNRAELLNKELKALQSGSPDVEAVALISEDGLVVASALSQDLDEIRVGGMSATLLSLGTRSSAELRRGNVEEIIVRGEQGYTVMLNAGQGTLLLVVANENAKLGLIFFDMRQAIEKLVKIL